MRLIAALLFTVLFAGPLVVLAGEAVSDAAGLSDMGTTVEAGAPAMAHHHAPASPQEPPMDEHCLFGHAGHCAQPALSASAPDVDPLTAVGDRPGAAYAVLPSKSLSLDPPPPRSV